MSALGKEVPIAGDNYFGDSVLPAPLFDFGATYHLETLLGDGIKPYATMEEFLAHLPDQLRAGYTLVHRSGSIQEATFENPRVLMFSPTANLVLSFNGHGEMVGGHAVEAIEYNEITDRFDFHEIDFRNGRPHDEKNPRKCTYCHTDAFIPNWRAYNDWRGAYAGNGDSFGRVSFDKIVDGYPTQDFRGDTLEKKKFDEFVASRETNGLRYRSLVNLTGKADWPYDAPGNEGHPVQFEPNRRLTIGLVYRLSRMLGVRISRTQLFRDYPASVVSQLLDCAPRDTAFVSLLKSAAEPAVLGRIRLDSPLNPKYREFADADSVAFIDFINALSIAGISPEYWSINPFIRNPTLSLAGRLIGGNAGLSSYTGFDDLNEAPLLAGLYLYGELIKSHPEVSVPKTGPTVALARQTGFAVELLTPLGKLIPLYQNETVKKELCVKLRPLAEQEMQRRAPIRIEIDSDERIRYERWGHGIPYALDRCIVCHAQRAYSAAPYIPFDQPALLARLLRDNDGALLKEIATRTEYEAPEDLRMPKGAFPLLPVQREQLLNYLRGLR